MFYMSFENILKKIDTTSQMSHLYECFEIFDKKGAKFENGVLLASTHDVQNAAYKIENETTYAIQFHPEVYHSTDGKLLLENFLVKIAKVNPDLFGAEVVMTSVECPNGKCEFVLSDCIAERK